MSWRWDEGEREEGFLPDGKEGREEVYHEVEKPRYIELELEDRRQLTFEAWSRLAWLAFGVSSWLTAVAKSHQGHKYNTKYHLYIHQPTKGLRMGKMPSYSFIPLLSTSTSLH